MVLLLYWNMSNILLKPNPGTQNVFFEAKSFGLRMATAIGIMGLVFVAWLGGKSWGNWRWSEESWSFMFLFGHGAGQIGPILCRILVGRIYTQKPRRCTTFCYGATNNRFFFVMGMRDNLTREASNVIQKHQDTMKLSFKSLRKQNPMTWWIEAASIVWHTTALSWGPGWAKCGVAAQKRTTLDLGDHRPDLDAGAGSALAHLKNIRKQAEFWESTNPLFGICLACFLMKKNNQYSNKWKLIKVVFFPSGHLSKSEAYHNDILCDP